METKRFRVILVSGGALLVDAIKIRVNTAARLVHLVNEDEEAPVATFPAEQLAGVIREDANKTPPARS
jgi:hypothetical protein